MAHFALVFPADAGHMLAMGNVGKALVRHGHRVTLVAPSRAASLAEQVKLPLYPLAVEELAPPWAPFTLAASWLAGQAHFLPWFLRLAEMSLKLLPTAFQELGVDGVVIDQVLPGGGTAAERVGVPFVTLASAVPWHEEPGVPPSFTGWTYGEGAAARLRNRLGYAGWEFFFRPVLGHINRTRRAWGLTPFRRTGETFSPLAQIAQLCPELDFPRRELPSVFHYIGSYADSPDRTADDRFPWARLDGRPLVFISMGTVPGPGIAAVFRRLLEACAGLDAQLVLGLGHWTAETAGVREQLGVLPKNALVVDFAPQVALLERASLLVTHGGANSTLEALGRGVPLVVLPRNADQPAIGARVEHAGVGLVGSYGRSSPARLRTLIDRVLGEDGFRSRARAMGKALQAAGGVDRAAALVEQALTTRRPVPRTPAGA